MTHLAVVAVPRDPDALKNSFTACLSLLGAIQNSNELRELAEEIEHGIDEEVDRDDELENEQPEEVENVLTVSDEELARYRNLFALK